MHGYAAWMLVLVLLGGCASAGAKEPATAPGGSQGASPNCFAIGEVAARESCFARMSDAELTECARQNPLACGPYKDMQAEREKLQQLEARVEQLSLQVYADYANNDAAYLDDLAQGLKKANAAWGEFRDAHCGVQPYLEGMARREAGDLAEACRLELTQKRVAELETVVSHLTEVP